MGEPWRMSVPTRRGAWDYVSLLGRLVLKDPKVNAPPYLAIMYWNPFSIYCLLMLIHKISIYPNAQYKRFSKVTKDKVSPYAPSSGLQVCRGQNFRLFVASGILIKFDILRRPQHLKKISHYIWHYLVHSMMSQI